MQTRSQCPFLFLALALLTFPQDARSQSAVQNGGDFSSNPEAKKLPADVILIKGAWSSASDSSTSVPEGGSIANNVYSNPYFALNYALPLGWAQKYFGPPPSDNGYYVLAQFRSADANQGSNRGNMLITAQDLFFMLTPAANALELADYSKRRLQADYKVEREPIPATIANHSFIRFDYFSPVAGLHWYTLATQIRCHAVQFIFTGHDPRSIESLIEEMNTMKLPAEASPILGSGGGNAPVCIKDYAGGENVLQRVDPVLTEHRFNPIPVRVIIDREGKVKHIHFLSAFPDQAKAITDALLQWRFRPYLRDGQPLEVETGILFGGAPRPLTAIADPVSE